MSVSISIAKKPQKEIVPKSYSLLEYLAREERAKEKHEFYNGTIIKMPNTKFTHNLIAMNMAFVLKYILKSKKQPYFVLGDGQKVYIESENVAVYPDALVVFENPQFFGGREDMLLNPIMVIEVLSRKTSVYDRTTKFDLYRLIPSFKEYVLINPQKIDIETRFREDNDLWRITSYNTDNQDISLKSLDINVNISEIYENVTL
jgi:Uma2 family endonuclease